MAAAVRKSKRRSAASSPSKLPNETVFLDEGLGSRIVADALRSEGIHVEIHRDHFSPGTPDSVWLTDVSCRAWIIFSKDRRIKQRKLELEAIRASKGRAFILTVANLSGADQARAFVLALGRIDKLLAKRRPPIIATVSRSGVVREI